MSDSNYYEHDEADEGRLVAGDEAMDSRIGKNEKSDDGHREEDNQSNTGVSSHNYHHNHKGKFRNPFSKSSKSLRGDHNASTTQNVSDQRSATTASSSSSNSNSSKNILSNFAGGLNKMVASKSFKKLTSWTRTAGGSGTEKIPSKSISLFGGSLESAFEAGGSVKPDFPCPVIISRCIDYIESSKGYEEIGIYRLSGSTVCVQKLKESFSNENSLDFEIVSEDPHAVTGVLKLFFRELSVPFLPSQLVSQIQSYCSELNRMQEAEAPSEYDRDYLLQNLAFHLHHELSSVSYCSLAILMKHLYFIESHNATNKMPLSNLIIIFSPCLNVPANVLGLLIRNAHILFPADNIYIPPSSPSQPASEDIAAAGPEGGESEQNPFSETLNEVIPAIEEMRVEERTHEEEHSNRDSSPSGDRISMAESLSPPPKLASNSLSISRITSEFDIIEPPKAINDSHIFHDPTQRVTSGVPSSLGSNEDGKLDPVSADNGLSEFWIQDHRNTVLDGQTEQQQLEVVEDEIQGSARRPSDNDEKGVVNNESAPPSDNNFDDIFNDPKYEF